MVEVWLPYRDVEIPVMLPDPINLMIQPKTVYPKSLERDALEKLKLLIGDKARPVLSPAADPVEKRFINRLLKRIGVEIGGGREVYIDIFREDILLGFRSSIWIPRLRDLEPRELLDGSKELDEGLPRSVYVDIVLDGGGRVHQVFGSKDGSHFEEAREEYLRGWCLRGEPASLIIASVGGSPWDESLILSISSLAKAAKILDGDSILIGVTAAKELGIPPTKLGVKDIEEVSSFQEAYLWRARRLLNNVNVVVYGSIPRIFASMMGVSRVKNVEGYIHRLPVSKKRSVLVFEDLYLSSVSRCTRSQGELGVE